MTPEQVDTLLSDVETELQQDVQQQLDAVASEFADGVSGATELVAAAFSVSSIRDMWRRKVPALMTRLRAFARRSAALTATDLGEPVPSGSELDAVLGPYQYETRPLLLDVGDSLAEAAQRVLADGVSKGLGLDELKASLLEAFSPDGSQLGPVRAQRIAQTESVRAYNAGVQAAAEALIGPDRPLVKQWLTRRDTRVREAHKDVNGQIRLLDDTFDVGGHPMRYPGDPTAPADLTVNCRCWMVATPAPPKEGNRVSASENLAAAAELASRMPQQLKDYWLHGEGAAKIRWGTPGAFDRCVKALRPDFPQDPEGLCANLYRDATGHWPGQKAEAHTGAMVALVPSWADAYRLAVDAPEAELFGDLHTTVFYLGDAADWSPEAQASVHQAMADAASRLSPVVANAFGAAHWNAGSEEPVWVYNVGDSRDGGTGHTLADVHREVMWSLEGRHGGSPDIPAQFTPWAPHIAAGYTSADFRGPMGDRCGPMVFDGIRVAFGGEFADYPLTGVPDSAPVDQVQSNIDKFATWSTPDPTALAFEDQQTGDGRVFAPGALYWDGNGPWPLMANENFDGHDDAALAGCIASLYRDGNRIGGDGMLYMNTDEGEHAAEMLAQGAPIGVSVDLDDVDLAFLDTTGTGNGEPFHARVARASVLRLPSGFAMRIETEPDVMASGQSMIFESQKVMFHVGPDGRVPASAFELSAAAGDPATGVVVDTQVSDGDYLMQITRGRVRGATLVTIPAFAGARIVLDRPDLFASAAELEASAAVNDYQRTVRHVRKSFGPVTASDVAKALKISITAARRHLARAAQEGEAVRLSRGTYTSTERAPQTDQPSISASLGDTITAAATGAVDLPVAPLDHAWDGLAAEQRVFDWANGDCAKLDKGFAWRDDSKPCEQKNSRKLGFTDIVNGELTIIPRGVAAARGALNGARGTGVNIPASEKSAVGNRLDQVRAHIDEVTGSKNMEEMQASAWAAMADMPPMPAAWFREPTESELPPGGPGVNYSNGRIFGWVAQSDVPHAGYAKRVVINELGRIDTTEFLRQRKTLDDGSTVKVGAFTMNAGHHRDGAECETAACQFDDTRTVAGIITVGMNARGMWFSGAAAPWLSEWDREVFAACQPSYHMKRGTGGQWKLSAVLSVPVPGHPSALLASAVVNRGQEALTASAMLAETEAAVQAEKARQNASDSVPRSELAELVASAVNAALDAREARAEAFAKLLAEGRTMVQNATTDEGN